MKVRLIGGILNNRKSRNLGGGRARAVVGALDSATALALGASTPLVCVLKAHSLDWHSLAAPSLDQLALPRLRGAGRC